ncbi:MAG: hypothetical protein AB7F76_04455 [Parvibaculaceae bacterium]|jgi:hypothetical protein
MHRRLFLASAAALATLPVAGLARADDFATMRLLIGKWYAKQYANGMELDNELTLAGDSRFAFTSSAYNGVYKTYQEGGWQYRGGWVTFITTYSEPRDPANQFLYMAPLQILGVSDTELQTNLGNATRIA